MRLLLTTNSQDGRKFAGSKKTKQNKQKTKNKNEGSNKGTLKPFFKN